MIATIKKSLIVQNKRTRKINLRALVDIIDVSFLIIINHIDWVPTWFWLGAIMSSIMSSIMSTCSATIRLFVK